MRCINGGSVRHHQYATANNTATMQPLTPAPAQSPVEEQALDTSALRQYYVERAEKVMALLSELMENIRTVKLWCAILLCQLFPFFLWFLHVKQSRTIAVWSMTNQNNVKRCNKRATESHNSYKTM